LPYACGRDDGFFHQFTTFSNMANAPPARVAGGGHRNRSRTTKRRVKTLALGKT
jgi:hypothetical protein